MRRKAHPALPWSRKDLASFEFGMETVGIDTRFSEAENTGAGISITIQHQFAIEISEARFKALGQAQDSCSDVIDTEVVEKFHRGTKAEAAGDVECAGFVAASVGSQGHVAAGIVGPVLYSCPSEFDWKDLILNTVIYIKNTPAFRAEEPFVAVCGQSVDATSFNVYRKDTKALDCVDEVEDIVALADIANGLEVYAEATEVIHPTNGKESGSAASLFYFLEGVIEAKPADDTSLTFFQELPAVVVCGEFLTEGHDDIAGFPGKAHLNGGDAFACVFDHCDFAGVAADHTAELGANTFAGRHPVGVVEAAPVHGVVGVPAHGTGYGPGEWGDGGMVEVVQIGANGKIVAIWAQFETHSFHDTL